jgi:hypothetical protein
LADLHSLDERIHKQLSLSGLALREALNESLQLTGDAPRVVAFFLQLIDLIFQPPLLFLQPGLLLGELVDLGVDEAGDLEGSSLPPQPAGELLLLRPERSDSPADRLAILLQLRESLPVVLHVIGDQGRDDVLPFGQLADLPDDASLEDVGPDVVLSAAFMVVAVVAHVVLESAFWLGPRIGHMHGPAAAPACIRIEVSALRAERPHGEESISA